MNNKFQGRKVIKAITEKDLEAKVLDSEKREWERVGKFTRQYNGHWCCVVERKSKLNS